MIRFKNLLIDFETFFTQAPQLNPSRSLIKGVICGVRVEDIKEPLMREIRYLDKLIDELAKGKTMEKILPKHPHESSMKWTKLLQQDREIFRPFL